MPSVSIALATYNGEQYIARQLESLATQTRLPAEVVVTDDCSTDDTLTLISWLAEGCPFPIHIHQNETRLGYRANFMRAASLCTSDLIAFCDQDDVWYPNKIKTCADMFTDDVLLVYHNADVVNALGLTLGSLRKYSAPLKFNPPQSLQPRAFSLGFTQMFRRELLAHSDKWPESKDPQFDGERMAHDQWFFSLASQFGTIGYIDEPLVAYMQHGKNLFGADLRKKVILRNLFTRYVLGLRK